MPADHDGIQKELNDLKDGKFHCVVKDVPVNGIHTISLLDKDKMNVLPQMLQSAGLSVASTDDVLSGTAAATKAAIEAAVGGPSGPSGSVPGVGGGGGNGSESYYDMAKMAGALAAAGVQQETAQQVAARAATAPSPAEAAVNSARGSSARGSTKQPPASRQSTSPTIPPPRSAATATATATASRKKKSSPSPPAAAAAQPKKQTPPQPKAGGRKQPTKPVVTPAPILAVRAAGTAAAAAKKKMLYDSNASGKPVFNGATPPSSSASSSTVSTSVEPTVVLKKDEWKCPACTYIEKNFNKECQMCGTPQPFMLVQTKTQKKKKKKKGGGRGQAISLASLLGGGGGGGGGGGCGGGDGGVRVPAQTIPRGVVRVDVPEYGPMKIQEGQNAFLFICSRVTYHECIDKDLFGLPFPEFRGMQMRLVPENNHQGRPPTMLYLFNISTTELHGVRPMTHR